MAPEPSPQPKRGILFWLGWLMTILPVLVLAMSAFMKVRQPYPPEVLQGMEHLGWSTHLLPALAITEVLCSVIYLIPQTAVLGAILLTGYLGGATATHVRVGDAFAAPIIVGVLVWLGLFLRDPRVRALIPWRRS